MCPFVDLPDPPQPMSVKNMVTLASAIRNNWSTPPEVLQQQLDRVQLVLDDPGSKPRGRERAERIMQLVAGRNDLAPATEHQPGSGG